MISDFLALFGLTVLCVSLLVLVVLGGVALVSHANDEWRVR